jgi:hypothetical protein
MFFGKAKIKKLEDTIARKDALIYHLRKKLAALEDENEQRKHGTYRNPDKQKNKQQAPQRETHSSGTGDFLMGAVTGMAAHSLLSSSEPDHDCDAELNSEHDHGTEIDTDPDFSASDDDFFSDDFNTF